MIERPAHTVGLLIAVFVGFMTSAEELATPQFEQLARSLNITGSLLAPLSMLYHSATALIVMAVAYALLCLLWQQLAPRR